MPTKISTYMVFCCGCIMGLYMIPFLIFFMLLRVFMWHIQPSWWRHQMETFSALLAICAGNSPVTGEFPAQRAGTRSFDIFFDRHPNKRLSKHWWGWWFETPSRPLWRHYSDTPWDQSHDYPATKEAIMVNICKIDVWLTRQALQKPNFVHNNCDTLHNKYIAIFSLHWILICYIRYNNKTNYRHHNLHW